MRHATAEYFSTHLVEPITHAPLNASGETLSSASRVIPWRHGVPVFSGIEPSQQWQDELKQTAGFMASYVGSPKQTAASAWVFPWLNDDMATDQSKMVCVGGSFVDDIPHVTKGHKFNIDLFSHAYIDVLRSVIDAQDTTFVSCWAEHLPFASNSVDYVYCRNALDHFSNPVQALIEMHRILKPGGKLCIGVYYNSSFVDAHETGIVDDEFLKAVIYPIFETNFLNMTDAEPTAAVFKNVRTKFLHYVGSKLNNAASLARHSINAHGVLTECFKSALYARYTHDGDAAKRLYKATLAEAPLFTTDIWRQLYSCLDLLAMTDKRSLVAAGNAMTSAGISENWSPVADLVFGHHLLSIADLPTEIAPIELEGYFNRAYWDKLLERVTPAHTL